MSKTPKHRWSKAETDYMLMLYGRVPAHLIHETYNRWAKRTNHASRTLRSLNLKAQSFGCSIRCQNSPNYISTSELASILGVKKARLYTWRTRLGLPLQKFGAGYYYAIKRDLTRFFNKHPHLLMGLSFQGVYWLFKDKEKAEKFSSLPLYRKQWPRHYAGSQQFNSIKDVHHYFGITP
jgi:hypothetical protein